MIYKFRSHDAPEAKGRIPVPGERKWTFSFILESGDDYLEVEVGQAGHDAFVRMLNQEKEDDTHDS